MDDKKNCSRNSDSLAALHPHKVLDNLLAHLSPFLESNSDRKAVRSAAAFSLPPPNNTTIARTAVILYASGALERDALRNLLRVVRRARRVTEDCTFSIVEYPIPYALEALYKAGREFGDDGRLAVDTLVKLMAVSDFNGPYTGIMFHKHVIALRDVATMYWESFSSKAAHKALSSPPFAARIALFARDSLSFAVINGTTRVKLTQTLELLNGKLTLGGIVPRGEASERSLSHLESEVSPSDSFKRANPSSTLELSAQVEESCPDDGDSDMRVAHPDGSTHHDRRTANKRVLDGFRRSNVRSASDMSGCSRVTYSDFLFEAAHSADRQTFALIWLSGITGIDVTRPMVLKRSARQRPRNDEILVDKKNSSIEYNVLRRKKKNDEKVWERCGLMCLPLPPEVIAGLADVARLGDAKTAIQKVERFYRKFSRVNAGQTPTLRRMRSSARAHFAPLGFTELEFGAISGRLPPSIRALSHYYHAQVSEMQWKFRTAYAKAADEWQMELPKLPLPAKKPAGQRNYLFCLPSESLATVTKMLEAIASEYERNLSQVSTVRQASDLERITQACNLHSLSLYAFQELAAGLRPTGNVAQFAHSTAISGSLTADKGSTAFAERSFSPLTRSHARLLEVAQHNKDALTHGAECLGIQIEDREPRSDLACMHTLSQGKDRLLRDRMTGQIHRQMLLTIPNIIDLNKENNWLRKTIAQLIYSLVPQWQADEFLGHRRCGRELTGDWSTASIFHFIELRNLLESRLAPIVPGSLYRALET
jgi:hypothetical protein